MTNRFLDAERQGRNEWWLYLIGLGTILFFWLILGSVLLALLYGWVMMDGNPATTIDTSTGMLVGVEPIVNYLALNAGFVLMLVGIWITIRLLHQRPLRSLITPQKQIDWKRMGQGFGLWLLLAALAGVVEYLLNPDIYTVSLNIGRFLPFALVVLIFTPLQTTSEELLFRGYILQASGRLSRNIWLLALVNGLLFMVPHLANPEVDSGPVLLAAFYLSIGAFFAFITLRDQRAELAIGAHAANNLFSALFANYTNSALQTESIFLVTELDPVYALASFWVMAFIFVAVLLRRRQPETALTEPTGSPADV